MEHADIHEKKKIIEDIQAELDVAVQYKQRIGRKTRVGLLFRFIRNIIMSYIF